MQTRAFRFVAWLLALLRVERHEIGRSGHPYLTRWVLLGTRFGEGRKLFLHYFHQSDYAGALHDHPWSFTSLLIWPGYFEHTESEVGHSFRARRCYVNGSPDLQLVPGCGVVINANLNSTAFDEDHCGLPERDHYSRRWQHALSILRRPALWRHRVEILPGRGCWTLVATGRKARSWGFWCPSGYRPWREHAVVEATGKDGCE
jgi:hypothetical protein